jgi:hypothetical protein
MPAMIGMLSAQESAMAHGAALTATNISSPPNGIS